MLFETGTLRFFEICFISPSNFVHLREPPLQDGRIAIVMPSNRDEHRRVVDMLGETGKRTIVRLLDSSGYLAELALELGAIRWVSDNTPQIANDLTARRELRGRLNAVHNALDEVVRELLAGSGRIHGKWYRCGQVINIRSNRSLNEELSRVCDDVFDAAPKIDNEIINRRELSSAAAAARRNLIERMITSSEMEELGLMSLGNPPERSIYRSLLGKEGLQLHRNIRGQWAFRKPTNHLQAQRIVAEIDEYFDSSVKIRQPITDLIDRLKAPPFGLREGPIPVLICAALLMRDAEVALYDEGAFCPKLTPAIMERLIKSPDLFSVRRWKVKGIRSRVFEQLEKLVLGNVSEGTSGKKRMLQVARPMMRFIRQLPDYTMATADLSEATLAIRNAFTQATEPDTLLFEQLPIACRLEPFYSGQRMKAREKDVHQFASCIRSAFEELRAAYPGLVAAVRISISDAFGVSSASPNSIQSHLQTIAGELSEYAAERDLKMLIGRILDDGDGDAWIEGVASLIAEKPLAKWRDEDRAKFNVRLHQFVRRLNLLSATVIHRPANATPRTTKSIRLAVTSTDFGQIDHVIHIDSNNTKRLRKLETAIERETAKSARY